jgi:hypothetical protein
MKGEEQANLHGQAPDFLGYCTYSLREYSIRFYEYDAYTYQDESLIKE